MRISRDLNRHPVDPDTGCINYLGSVRADGYGQMKIGGENIAAHRFFYIKYKGPITDGLLVLHRCNNKVCINPEHLYLGTYKQNLRDRERNGGIRASVLDTITAEQYEILANASYTVDVKAELTGLKRSTAFNASQLAMTRKRAEAAKSLTPLELLLAKARAELASESMKEFK